MKTIRIGESGALGRLGEFLVNRQAALSDRLQQQLDSLNPQPVTQGGVTWQAPEGTGAGTFTVEPIPSQPGKEMAYVKDSSGMEVMVDVMAALDYLQDIPMEGITPEVVWNALNDASAESPSSNQLISPEDEAAQSAWDQQFTARSKKQAAEDQDTWNMFERLRELMGDGLLLEELVRAMSSREARENFDFIIRMHDLGSEFGEVEEEEEEIEEEEPETY